MDNYQTFIILSIYVNCSCAGSCNFFTVNLYGSHVRYGMVIFSYSMMTIYLRHKRFVVLCQFTKI